MKGHKHWPKDHPFYEMAPFHEATRKECDEMWRWYMHGHEGQPCEKQVLPGNKTATCVLTMSPDELEARLSKRVTEQE